MARALTFAMLLLLSIPSAFGQARPAFGQYLTVIAACTRDVTHFCHAAQNPLVECIERYFQDFHEQCRAALLQTAAVREACDADIAQHCHAARPGAGRILQCVKKHFPALGQSCRDAIGHAVELKVGSY